MKKLIAIALLSLMGAAAAFQTVSPAEPNYTKSIQLAGELGDVDPQEKHS